MNPCAQWYLRPKPAFFSFEWFQASKTGDGAASRTLSGSGDGKDVQALTPWNICQKLHAGPFGHVLIVDGALLCIHADISKHPILSSVESRQVQQYLGSRWSFGSGSDAASSNEATPADITAAAEVMAQILEATGNMTGNSTGS